MLLLDTHALLWHTLDPDQLGHKAQKALSKAEQNEYFISSISIWELGVKMKNMKLDIGMNIEDYNNRLLKVEKLTCVPVTAKIWIHSLSLNWNHKDPADRVIVATALDLGVPLVTKDQLIQNFKRIKTIW